MNSISKLKCTHIKRVRRILCKSKGNMHKLWLECTVDVNVHILQIVRSSGTVRSSLGRKEQDTEVVDTL
jgi:hypothetical protein